MFVPLLVTAVWPPAGSALGGQRVVITGTGFGANASDLQVTGVCAPRTPFLNVVWSTLLALVLACKAVFAHVLLPPCLLSWYEAMCGCLEVSDCGRM